MENSLHEHYGKIRRVLIVILILNWAVALAKIIYGFLTRCQSISADGFHSLSDGASNIIGIIGIHFACQPQDKEHPYGHKKYETFFSLGIALLLFLVCAGLIHQSFERLNNPVAPQINLQSFIVMLLTLGINIWVMNYERGVGKKMHSDILVSDAMHTRADIFTSVSVIIALVVIKAGFPILDPIATIMIAIFIAYSAFKIVRESSTVLCDTAMLDEQKITAIVMRVKGVRDCHKIRTRGRPDDIHIDLHVQVNGSMHLDNAHKISYCLEEEIKKEIPGVTDVVVHMEPLHDNLEAP